MRSTRRTPSVVAERAFRYLAARTAPVSSVELAQEILATRVAVESAARQVLEAAFGGDPRLVYEEGCWRHADPAALASAMAAERVEGDRALILLRGGRLARGSSFELTSIAAIRMSGDDVAAACGGAPSKAPSGERLRRAVIEIIEGAIPVLYDPPGALASLERWLDFPLDAPISLRRLGQQRLGLRREDDLETLAERLGLYRRESDDPLDQAELLDDCLEALRRPAESLEDVRHSLHAAARPIDWSRYAFDRGSLNAIPHVAGTYRFFDADGGLLYVGKAKNLNRRIGSYFQEGARRSVRVQRLVDAVYRMEVEPMGSDLEAVLSEAAEIARRKPSRNVQRAYRVRGGRADRLRSILILEPASAPFVFRAYLIRDGKLVGRVPIGPRGGGFRRIERLLEDYFFSFRAAPTADEILKVDVEIIGRWLSAHRDRVVAFDPTHLRHATDVVEKLRWVVERGRLFDPDGSPILIR